MERPPAHAGTFYPADPAGLGALVGALLADAADQLPPRTGERLLGALVPHAGLEYSGRIAALGWSAVAAADPTVIVIVGTDHHGRGHGVAVWTGGSWATPLGPMATHSALAERVAALGPPFHADDGAHGDEHSIEVQLPLIRRALPRARIVGLLAGLDGRAAEQAGAELGGLISSMSWDHERVVIVASSDLAHYPADAIARRVDLQMLEPILKLDASDLGRRELLVEGSGLRGLACGMCGVPAVQLVLTAMQVMGARHASLLGHATSADAAGHDRRRTVGYAAVAFTR